MHPVEKKILNEFLKVNHSLSNFHSVKSYFHFPFFFQPVLMFKICLVLVVLLVPSAQSPTVAPSCEAPHVAGYLPVLDRCDIRATPIPMGKFTQSSKNLI